MKSGKARAYLTAIWQEVIFGQRRGTYASQCSNRAGSPEFTEIYGLPSLRRHPAPSLQSLIICQLKSKTNFLIIHEMITKCRSTKLQSVSLTKWWHKQTFSSLKAQFFKTDITFVSFFDCKTNKCPPYFKIFIWYRIGIGFILLGEVEAAPVTVDKTRWNYPKSNWLLRSALGIKFAFLQWGHMVNPTMVFFDVERPWSFSGRNLTHHHSQLVERSIPDWFWCGWKL